MCAWWRGQGAQRGELGRIRAPEHVGLLQRVAVWAHRVVAVRGRQQRAVGRNRERDRRARVAQVGRRRPQLGTPQRSVLRCTLQRTRQARLHGRETLVGAKEMRVVASDRARSGAHHQRGPQSALLTVPPCSSRASSSADMTYAMLRAWSASAVRGVRHAARCESQRRRAEERRFNDRVLATGLQLPRLPSAQTLYLV